MTVTIEKPIEIFPAFEEYLQPARFKVAYGGRGSGKTRTFVTLLVDNVLYFKWRVVCFREIMKSIDDSVYQEIIDEIDRRDLGQYFNILRTEIQCYSGGVFKFDGLYRNQQKIKGYSGFDCAFIEEAANVTADSWKMLIPTLRKANSEIWVCFNPESPLDDTYQRFVSQRVYPDFKDGKRYCVSKKINYTDNPRFPPELLDDMEIMKDTDFELYQHVYMGEPVANSSLAIIPPAWIAAAVDLHLFLGIDDSGDCRMGFDVSDEGDDANATTIKKGCIVKKLYEWKDNDPNSAADQAFDNALAEGVTDIVFDDIGVGAGAKGELRNRVAEIENKAQVPPNIIGFTASNSVENPNDEYQPKKTNGDMFLNLKAQYWWRARDMFYNAFKARKGKDFDIDNIVSLDSSTIDPKLLEKLKAELSQPRREYVKGKVKVESKEKMARRGVKSPNLADSFIMVDYEGDQIDTSIHF